MDRRKPARNNPKSFSTDSPASLLRGNSTAQHIRTVKVDSVIEIMPFRYLSDSSDDSNEDRPGPIPKRRSTIGESVPKKTVRLSREIKKLLEFQANLKMTLKPGAKRERRPTIQVPPMSAGPRKAPTKKKAKKPPVKVPVPILVLVPESDSDDDMPLQARPMQQLPENQTIRETALVQIAPNLHHFGDELFREMIANFRRGVAEKSNNQQHFITTPHYNLAQFPITANFTACTGYNGTDQRITCCKMFDNTGIIHMEARTQRKLSTSVKYAINFFMISGKLTFQIFLNSQKKLLGQIELLPFSCLKLNAKVFYVLSNNTDNELFCFFLRDSDES